MAFVWDLWRYKGRPKIMRYMHLVWAIIRGIMSLIVWGCFFWFWWTGWSSLNGTAWLMLLDFIPTTLLIATILPWDMLPPMPMVLLTGFWSVVEILAGILLMILFGDAAWDTDNIYRNEIVDDIANHARTPMLIIWFWAIPVMSVSVVTIAFMVAYVYVYTIGLNPVIKYANSFKALFASTPIGGIEKVLRGAVSSYTP